MSYVYGKSGRSFGGLGQVTLRPDVIEPPTVEQSTRSVCACPIVSGPAPTAESTLSPADVPTYIPTRSVLSPPPVEVQTQVAAINLREALYKPPAVDVSYQEPTLFTDVPVRPTLTAAMLPTALPTIAPRTVTQALTSEARPSQLTTAYVGERTLMPLGQPDFTSLIRVPDPLPTAGAPVNPAGSAAGLIAAGGYPQLNVPTGYYNLPGAVTEGVEDVLEKLVDEPTRAPYVVPPDPATTIAPMFTPKETGVQVDTQTSYVPEESGVYDPWAEAGGAAAAAAAGGGFIQPAVVPPPGAQVAEGGGFPWWLVGAGLLAYLVLRK